MLYYVILFLYKIRKQEVLLEMRLIVAGQIVPARHTGIENLFCLDISKSSYFFDSKNLSQNRSNFPSCQMWVKWNETMTGTLPKNLLENRFDH